MNVPKRKIVIAKRPSARRVPVFAEDEPPTTPWNRPRPVRVDDRPTVRAPRPRSSGMVAKPVVPPPPRSFPPPLPLPVIEPERPSMVAVSRAPVLPPEPALEPTQLRRPKPRWTARIAVLLVIVAAELWVARYAHVLRLPDLVARALAGD